MLAMSIFHISALILSAAALGGFINYKFIGLPSTIGHMVFALLFSVAVILLGNLGWMDTGAISEIIASIDFSDVVLHGMLSFLLFAGALHINLNDLKNVKYPVGILATFGVITATFLTGTLTWAAAQWIGIELPYIYALLFGSLISPTDPIAVLSILKQVGISKSLYVKIGGESLFNDGVGVVIFLALLSAATTTSEFNVLHFFQHFFVESFGGLTLGLILGWMTYKLMHSIDEYKVEVMLTLALVMGGYALAEVLHLSAPLCMVAAGLVIGNHGRSEAMSDVTRHHVDIFWELIDEILNAVLFLLIGLEIMIITLSGNTIWLGLLATLAVLVGRFISVGVPVTLMRFKNKFEPGTIRLMTWGGLRGGLSIAMALSLPSGDEKSVILTLTYIVVLFSIIVQGLTFRPVIKSILKK